MFPRETPQGQSAMVATMAGALAAVSTAVAVGAAAAMVAVAAVAAEKVVLGV